MKKVILVRHAVSEDNMAKRYPGDSPIYLKGGDILEKTKCKLANEPYEVYYSSPDLRCIQTGAYLTPKKPRIEYAIAERNYGIFAGHTYEEIEALYPDCVKSWFEDSWNYLIPNGESLAQMHERVIDFYKRLIQNDSSALLITSEGVIRLLISHVLGEDKHYYRFHPSNSSVTMITIEGDYASIQW